MSDSQLIVTALKKYIQIINEMQQLRAEIAKREAIRKQLVPILTQYMDSIDQKKIKTQNDTLTYTVYKNKENYSKKCTERVAREYFKNERQAQDFLKFYDSRRQVNVRRGIKHTKPRRKPRKKRSI